MSALARSLAREFDGKDRRFLERPFELNGKPLEPRETIRNLKGTNQYPPVSRPCHVYSFHRKLATRNNKVSC